MLAAVGAVEPPPRDIAALPPDVGKAADDINEQIRREMGAAPSARLPAERTRSRAGAATAAEAGGRRDRLARRAPDLPGAALVTPATAVGGEAAADAAAGEPPHAEPGRADDFTR